MAVYVNGNEVGTIVATAPEGYFDTSDADISEKDIAKDKIAYGRTGKIVGSADVVPEFAAYEVAIDNKYVYYLKHFCSSENYLFKYSYDGNSAQDPVILFFDDKSKQYKKVLSISDIPITSNERIYYQLYEDPNSNIYAFVIPSNIRTTKTMPIAFIFDKTDKVFKAILTVDNLTQFNYFSYPQLTILDDNLFLSYTDYIQGIYLIDNDIVTRLDSDISLYDGYKKGYNIVKAYDSYFAGCDDGIIKIDKTTFKATLINTTSEDDRMRSNHLHVVGNYLFDTHDRGLAIYDTSLDKFITIYGNKSSEYFYASSSAAMIYKYKNNYFYTDTGPNLNGMLLIDPINLTYKQVIEETPTTQKVDTSTWCGFIVLGDDLFCYSKRQYTPNTWITKWDDNEKMFKRISDIIGYNYFVLEYNNNLYMRCKNPTSDQTSKKYNIYKYNDRTQYFDTIIATTASEAEFRFYVLLDHLLLISGDYIYMKSTSDVFDKNLGKFSNDFMKGDINTVLVDPDNQIYFTYALTSGTSGWYLFDNINLTMSSLGINQSNSLGWIIDNIDNTTILITRESVNKYNPISKRFDSITPRYFGSGYDCIYDKTNKILYSNFTYASKWNSEEKSFNLDVNEIKSCIQILDFYAVVTDRYLLLFSEKNIKQILAESIRAEKLLNLGKYTIFNNAYVMTDITNYFDIIAFKDKK